MPHPRRSSTYLTHVASIVALATVACDAPDRALPVEPPSPPALAVLAGDLAQTQGFRKAVSVAGIRAHQAALQRIADDNGNTRFTGTSGYTASVEYVRDAMLAAGYNVTVQSFPVTVTGDRTPPAFQIVAPTPRTFIPGVEFRSFSFSGSGDVTALLYAVDLQVPLAPGQLSTSGCEAADFAGFPAGAVALIQRGTCDFGLKAANAQAAGAVGVIIMNSGLPGQTDVVAGTLGMYPVTIPVIGISFAEGVALANGALNGNTGSIVRVRVDWVSETTTSSNVIAETPGGDPENVVVVGGWLDGDRLGPGINMGSGAAAMLEIARAFTQQERTPTNRLRFAFFGAWLQGHVGANYYLGSLSPADKAKIQTMISFDVIGSPNFVRFLYDSDNSVFAGSNAVAIGPAGSGTIEQLFADYFASRGLAVEPTELTASGSLVNFALAGIPVGGIFSGAQGVKTAAQAAIFGGTSGIAHDPCILAACDTFDNVSLTALDELSDAAAHATLLLSRRNFTKNPLVTP